MNNKKNIKIVLSRTWASGNIGSSLRAMKNFDFTDISTVNPCNFIEEEISTMAAGAKDHIKYLNASKKSDDLDKELADVNVVYAFSNRARKHFKIITPEEMSKEILSFHEDTKIVLLFGNETNGLDNEEIDLADKIVSIPVSENYGSFNLSTAVTLALYDIHKTFNNTIKNNKIDEKLINHPDFEVTKEKENRVTLKERNSLQKLVSSIISEKLIRKKIPADQLKENINFLFKKMVLNKKELKFIRTFFEIIKRKL